jgi:Uma2 family endonuclease
MVSITPKTNSLTAQAVGEQRVVFHHLNWQSYLQILHALPQTRSGRLTYDQGTLEITMPLEEHEFFGRLLGLFIRILVEELGQDLKTMGSTTLNYPNLDKGAEADEAFYIQNHASVAGRSVDLSQDPPPDLVVEVDITHTDIDKNRLYASMGVPELWRFDGHVLQIYQLQEGQYVEVETSPTFPNFPKTRLYEFLEQCRTSEVQASKALRQWAQETQSN